VSSLTRWVLAHKRIVVVIWVALTIAGTAASGPATDALEPGFSVPNGEGWETNEAIAARYRDTGGDTAPLVPVVTLPAGKTVDSPGIKAELAAIDERLREALPGARRASFASTGDRTFVSDDGRTIFSLAYPRPEPNSQWGEAPKAAKAAVRALEGVTVAGAPVRLTGVDALVEDSGAENEGTGVLLEALIGGFGALLVLTFVFDDQVGPFGQAHQQPVSVGGGQVDRRGHKAALVADLPHLDVGDGVEVQDQEPGLAAVQEPQPIAPLLDGLERLFWRKWI
jgi:putative drug exporter of the RND superfamily